MTILDAYLKQAWWRRKQVITICIISLLFFSLKEPLTDLFNDYVVKLVLSKFSKEEFGWIRLILYFALLAAGVVVLYRKCIVDAYQPSLVSVFLMFFLSVLYWIERINGAHYCFHPLKTFGIIHISQTDPLFVVLALTGMSICFNYSVSRRFVPGTTFLRQDLPIDDIAADELNRTKFYKDVIDRLDEVAFDSEKSFAIGVNSTWGYGKTSLLKIIKGGLKKKKNIACIEYNPWLSANKSSLTYDFFSVLEHQLSVYINNTNILLDYAKRVSKVDNDENKLKGLADLFESEDTLRDKFNEIGELIRYTGRRFVIIIDDLDRLDNEEVFEVLRLIRNVANFPRLTYLVAYDKYYVINALENKKIRQPEQYLEKIFELEIELPKIEDIKIRQVLNETIKTGFDKLTLTSTEQPLLIAQLFDVIFNSAQSASGKAEETAKHINTIFRNKRDILKFANSFLLSLSLNKDNLYLPDLFILEALKLNNSQLYHILAGSDKYLDIDNSGTVHYYQLYETGRSQDIANMNASRYGLFSIMANARLNYQKDLIRVLFSKPLTTDWHANKSIVVADNFKTYFIFAEPQGTIAVDQLTQLLQ